MFDIGFSELVVIGLVALIVIGPERMPVVARTVGALLGRAQRYVNEVKSEIRREMHVEDMKKFEAEMRAEVQSLENTIGDSVKNVESDIHNSIERIDKPTVDAAAALPPAGETPDKPAA